MIPSSIIYCSEKYTVSAFADFVAVPAVPRPAAGALQDEVAAQTDGKGHGKDRRQKRKSPLRPGAITPYCMVRLSTMDSLAFYFQCSQLFH